MNIIAEGRVSQQSYIIEYVSSTNARIMQSKED